MVLAESLLVIGLAVVGLAALAIAGRRRRRWRIEPREVDAERNGIFLVRGDEPGVLVHPYAKGDDVEASYGVAVAKRMRRDLE